jgi:hypothetical protein
MFEMKDTNNRKDMLNDDGEIDFRIGKNPPAGRKIFAGDLTPVSRNGINDS